MCQTTMNFKPTSASSFVLLFAGLNIMLCSHGEDVELPTKSTQTADPQKVAYIPGDVVLGGLFPIHHGTVCDVFNNERGVHRLEAMLYAVDKINKNKNILPNLILGAEIRDTCSLGTVALEQALSFVLESGRVRTPKNCSCQCFDDGGSGNKIKTIVGVVGAASSSVSIHVANLLRLFQVSQVSYASTSPTLSDKSRYDYFVRTVPPDTFQARALVDIMKHFKWSAVFTVHSEGNYGDKGMQMFEKTAKESGICVVSSKQVNDATSEVDFDKIIEEFLRQHSTRVIVLFCTNAHTRELLAASQRKSASDFTWVASDTWGTRQEPVKGFEDVADGAITVTLKLNEVSDFNDVFSSLTPKTNTRNPWFGGFWEKYFDCTIEETAGKVPCDPDLRLSDEMGYDDKVPFVIDAVYAFAHALDKMYKELCPSQGGLCKNMLPFKGENFFKILQNISFNGESGYVKFDENGDSAGIYDIMLFRGGKYDQIGSWDGHFNTTNPKLDNEYLFLRDVNSSCGATCQLRQKRQYAQDNCCWTCENCTNDKQYVKDNKCEECSLGERPNDNFTGCAPLPRTRLNKLASISLSCISALGIATTCLVTILFVIHNGTPLVRASGRELMYALLLGICLCYVSTILLVSLPVSVTSCYVQRIFLGLPLTLCYAALLTKTCRISRIFNSSQESVKPLMCITPISQVLLLLMICSVQIFLSMTNIYLNKPALLQDFREVEVLLLCNFSHYDLVFSWGAYNFLLVVLCTYFAFKTRRTPANFNEARFIGSAMYLTCAIWIILYIVHIVLDENFKAQMILISLNPLVNGTTLLVCIYGRKVYILLFQPTRNSRSRSMQNWRISDDESSRFNGVTNASCATLSTLCVSNMNINMNSIVNTDSGADQNPASVNPQNESNEPVQEQTYSQGNEQTPAKIIYNPTIHEEDAIYTHASPDASSKTSHEPVQEQTYSQGNEQTPATIIYNPTIHEEDAIYIHASPDASNTTSPELKQNPESMTCDLKLPQSSTTQQINNLQENVQYPELSNMGNTKEEMTKESYNTVNQSPVDNP